jgi:hypothetical protein
MKVDSKIIGLMVVVLAGVGYAYFFTDTFLSPSEKFIKELNYFEELRYDTEEYKIQDYFDARTKSASILIRGVPGEAPKHPDPIKLSKDNFREKVTYENAMAPVPYTSSLTVFTNDLCYDQTSLTLWVMFWENEEAQIYYWSP